MAVDVRTEIVIGRPRPQVAAYAIDPDNATAWYANIKAVEWRSPKPLAAGSRIAFVAEFFGRRLAYTYEIAELVPGERLVMRTSEGPFPMETTYTWEGRGRRSHAHDASQPRRTVGVLAGRGAAMAAAMRRANRKDLARLKSILEQ